MLKILENIASIIKKTIFKLKSVFFIFVFIHSSNIYAQHVDAVRFRNFDVTDGLSNNWINSITEDSLGRIWTGTRAGLSIFNGTSCQFLKHEIDNKNSLSMDDISEVFYSRHDIIYAGTWGGGLNVINPITKSVKIADRDFPNSKKFHIKTMAEDSKGNLWVGTYGSGLYKYDFEKDKYIKTVFDTAYPEMKERFDFCQDMCISNDTIWISSRNGGLGYLVTGSDQLHPIIDNNKKPVLLNDVTCIFPYENEIILGTQQGEIFFYDKKNTVKNASFDLKLSKQHQNRVNSINLDSQNHLWFCTTSGLYKYYKDKDELHRITSTVSHVDYTDIFCSYVDSRGIVWFGNWGKGIYSYSENFKHLKEINFANFTLSSINDIQPLNDSILLLGSNNGIVIHNEKNKLSRNLELNNDLSFNVTDNIVLGLAKYGDDVLVAVDGAGLFLIDQEFKIKAVQTEKNSKFKNTSITCVEELDNGDIWVGSWANGIVQMNHEKGIYKEFLNYGNNKTINSVFCAFLSHDKKIWLGTQQGILIYDPIDGTFTERPIHVHIENKVDTDLLTGIRGIKEDHNNNMWLATIFGLIKYNPETEEIKLFTENDGLSDKIIYSLQLVNNNLWGTTKAGLVRIEVETNEITNYSTQDGLVFNAFNDNGMYLSNDGLLYLGNGNRVIFFDPKNADVTKHPIRFFVEEFYIKDIKIGYDTAIFNKPIIINDSINLTHNEDNISFSIAIQDYQTTIGDRYAHKLIGVDDDWIIHNYSHNFLKYTNLSPGEYELKLTSIDEKGKLGTDIKSLFVFITKPFWETWWFYTLCALAFIGFIYIYVKTRTKNIIEQKKNLERVVRDRTKEINTKNIELNSQREAMESNVRYASLLQTSLLPSQKQLNQGFANNFVFYKPKDVVSGDFYFYEKIGDYDIFAIADCTGHGVSGAFLSVLGITSLRLILSDQKTTKPNEILDELHNEMQQSLNKESDGVTDGMDITVIRYNNKTKILDIASALMSPFLISESGDETTIQSNRFPIGGNIGTYKNRTDYDCYTKKLEEDHTLYLFSDGYQDQFGGKDGKKFMKTKFRKLLSTSSNKTLETQQKIIAETFEEWKNDHDQIDDVLVAGIKLEI